MLRRLSRSGKLWTVNGAISDLYRKKYFYLDPSNILLPKIDAGEYTQPNNLVSNGRRKDIKLGPNFYIQWASIRYLFTKIVQGII